MKGSVEDHNKGMEGTLKDLVKAGRKARRSLENLEGLYKPTDLAIQIVSREGFDITKEQLSSHIHVTSTVMGELDEVYLRHYASEGPASLLHCFRMMGVSATSVSVREKFEEYLDEVEKTLNELSSSPSTTISLEQHDLHAFGLKHAADKLKPLFGPVFGRMCLPLPTRAMLHDLRTCLLEVDKDIMSEVLSILLQSNSFLTALQVGRWFDGLSEHMMDVKGHESSVCTWSEAMALKLKSLCPLQSGSKQEELILLVSTMRYPRARP